MIELDPTIAAVFQSSTAISTTNGRSFSMLKVGSKRRRTKSQIEADMVNGSAKAAETSKKINELNLFIAQQEQEKQAQAEEMAKQKAELLKMRKLEQDLLLAKAKADKGKEASDDIQRLLQQGVLMNNAAG